MKEFTIFYAGRIYAELDEVEYARFWKTCDPEIYNGAYFLDSSFSSEDCWYRLDGTPVPLEDVPKELRLLVLLLT